MDLDEFDYHLPKELIAQNPVRPRNASRLLVVKGDDLQHKAFFDIIDHFEQGDVLVLNNTKVMQNKLYGKKSTGADANIIIECKEDDGLYRCRVQTKHPKPGNQLLFRSGLKAIIKEQNGDTYQLEFNKAPEPVIEKYGQLPVPNYVKGQLKRKDHYQTIFASAPGSLAAPTAGLHFTRRMLKSIADKGIKIVYVTLHVSFGTFKPILGSIENHMMDHEHFTISQETADAINSCTGRLIICGTTSFKALESGADASGRVRAGPSWSNLFIYPGYGFRVKPDMMITNFHMPKSTLLLFVSAYFGKDTVLNAYNEAVRQKYRLFSFGDACLFIKS